MEYSISEVDPGELKELDQAITDFNIKIVPEIPRAEIHRLDFAVKAGFQKMQFLSIKATLI